MTISPTRQATARLNRALRRARGELFMAACDAAMVLVDGTKDRLMTATDCEVTSELMQLLQSRAWHADTPAGVKGFELTAVVERTLGHAPCQQQEHST